MIDFSLSWLPFVVIAVANFAVSWLYYSPVAPWFKTWQVGIGVDPNPGAMPRLMGGAVVGSLLLSYGMQVVVHSIGATTFGAGALVGLVAWLAFVVTHSLNTQFEGRKPVVLLINNCLYALTYVVFGGVVAIWR